MKNTKKISFIKMHGIGNDFVIFDARSNPAILNINRKQKIDISDRYFGIGCDQIIILDYAQSKNAHIFMYIYNQNGNEVNTCGNASRCVAYILMEERKENNIIIETSRGLIVAKRLSDKRISVNLGDVKLHWTEIPLTQSIDTNDIPISFGNLPNAVGVNIGNPHVVFFIKNIEDINLNQIGPIIENNKIFLNKTNVSICSIIGKNIIKMRVWERGVGITKSCGSAACAAGIAAVRRNLTDRKVQVLFDRGFMNIEWLMNNEVILIGTVEVSFYGFLNIT